MLETLTVTTSDEKLREVAITEGRANVNVSFIISYSCLCFLECYASALTQRVFLLVYLIHIDHDASGDPEGDAHSTDKQMSRQPRETLLKSWPLGLKSSVMFQPRPVLLSQKPVCTRL